MSRRAKNEKLRVEICLALSVYLLFIQGSTQIQAGGNRSRMTIDRVWTYSSPRVDVTGSVSQDGRYLAFEDRATGDLAIHDLISGQNRHLTHNETPGAESLWAAEISRDSSRVAYSWRNRDGTIDLRLVGLDGSGARVLFRDNDVNSIEPEGWLPDGRDILARVSRKDGANEIVLISTGDGSLRVLKRLSSRRDSAAHLSLSPDGRYIAYDFHPSDESSQEDVSILSIDGASDTPLVEHPADDNVLGWSSDGKWVLFRGDRAGADDMWAIPVTADGRPGGEPQLIKKNVGGSGRGYTEAGSFFYETARSAGLDADIYIGTLDPETGRLVGDPKKLEPRLDGPVEGAGWSQDGKYLAYYRLSERDDPPVMVIRALATGQERELSPPIALPAGRYAKAAMRWSPDGRSILRKGRHDGKDGLYLVAVETGHFTPVVEVPQGTYISHALWSPDGKAIFYRRWNESGSRILVRTLENGQETELLRGDASALLCPHFALSPDGRQLAFGSPWFPGRGVTALNVIPTAGGKPHILFKEQGGQELAVSGMNIRGQGLEWTPDGRYVLFIRGDYTRKEFWRVAAEGGEPERLGLELTSAPPPELCLHPDGRRIAYNRLQPRPTDRELWVLKDFLPD